MTILQNILTNWHCFIVCFWLNRLMNGGIKTSFDDEMMIVTQKNNV